MMKCVKRPPESVFNTNSENMVKFLEGEHRKVERGEKISLYPHQVEAVLAVRDYLANPQKKSNIALVVLPTGCGKTGVAVLSSYALNASRVLVITPSIIISRQIHKAYKKFLINHKVIKETPENRQFVLPTTSLIQRTSEIQDGMSSMVMVVNAHKIGGQSSVKIEDIPRDGYDLVIVDEAHHYPAPTWKLLVDHFCNSHRLFLTATPEHKGKPILPTIPPCYELKRNLAIAMGIVRDVMFDELTEGDEQYLYPSIAIRMEQYLNEHDKVDPTINHQGMVLTQTKNERNSAIPFCDIYNRMYPNKCAVYVTETKRDVLDAFIAGKIRVLVIIGRLLEGFDHEAVSVLGIVRNIAPTSRVLFAQFVGRAVRKNSPVDCVPAQIVTHEKFGQLQNYNTFEKLAEVDPSDEEEEDYEEDYD